MGRSARLPDFDDEPDSLSRQVASMIGAAIARNPVLVSGTTAFLVALAYVSANALWYQPHFHSGVFFATRDAAYDRSYASENSTGQGSDTTIRFVRDTGTAAAQSGDPTVERVQSVLRDLSFYEGEVDGLAGPNTRHAVENYQKTVGLLVTGEIDGTLLDQLGTAETTTAGIPPHPAPAPRDEQIAVNNGQVTPETKPDSRVLKIQAGLKAFGNDSIEIDGIVGARTEAAIREFQSLFGLPVTGEPDVALYEKMREIGLTG